MLTSGRRAVPPGFDPARLHADQGVHLSVEGDQVVIRRVDASRLTLEQRLAVYDPERHGGRNADGGEPTARRRALVGTRPRPGG
jgi:hypothetical protein